MYSVTCLFSTPRGLCADSVQFDTELEARQFINRRANGVRMLTLLDPDGEPILTTRTPVPLTDRDSTPLHERN